MTNDTTEFIHEQLGVGDEIAVNAANFLNELKKRASPLELLAIAQEVVAVTLWVGGPQGPSLAEIKARVEATRGVLEKYGLGDLDPAKAYATMIVLAKLMAPRAQ